MSGPQSLAGEAAFAGRLNHWGMNRSAGAQLSGEGAWVLLGPHPFQVPPRSIGGCACSCREPSTSKGNFYSISPLGFFDGIMVQPSLGLEVGSSP